MGTCNLVGCNLPRKGGPNTTDITHISLYFTEYLFHFFCPALHRVTRCYQSVILTAPSRTLYLAKHSIDLTRADQCHSL